MDHENRFNFEEFGKLYNSFVLFLTLNSNKVRNEFKYYFYKKHKMGNWYIPENFEDIRALEYNWYSIA